MFVPHTTIKLHAFFALFLLMVFQLSTAYSADWELQNPLPTGKTLNAVWSAGNNDTFAVGGFGTIRHYDGTRWIDMNSNTELGLSDVWGSSGRDVFAVGDGGIILHYDGIRWTTIISNTIESLLGV